MTLFGLACVYIPACADSHSGRHHPRRRLADRAPQPAGRAFPQCRRHPPALCPRSRPRRIRLPPLVFIHGASANLNDQMVPLQAAARRPRRAVVRRPAGPWLVGARARTTRRRSAQAKTIAALMDRTRHRPGDPRRPFVRRRRPPPPSRSPTRSGHSGLVLLSPATHPWPGGATSWYYSARQRCRSSAGCLPRRSPIRPALRRLAAATACVFAPNKVPDDYAGGAAIPLVLRPGAFRANAIDVAGLYRLTSRPPRRATRRSQRRPSSSPATGHGRRRADPLGRACPRHPGRRAGLGAAISATSRTGSRRDLVVAGDRECRPACRATCRRWRGKVEARIAGDRFRRRHRAPSAKAARKRELAPL